MHKIIITGNLGKDAEIKNLQSGKQCLNFSVGVQAGTKAEPKTVWYNCTSWNEKTITGGVVNYLRKGTKVLIEGVPGARAYNNQSGEAQVSMEIMINNIELIGGAVQNTGIPNTPAPVQNYQAPVQNPVNTPAQAPVNDWAAGGDDLPF